MTYELLWLLGIPLIGALFTCVIAGQRALIDGWWFWYFLYGFSVTIPAALLFCAGIVCCIYYVGHPFTFPPS